MKPEAVMAELRERGLLTQIAKHFGIARQAVDAWRIVPAERVIDVAEISGIDPHVIRPDVFPDSQGKRFAIQGPRTRAAQRRLDRLKSQKRRRIKA
jgi:hypothetical protein